jgi:hypothetical protein
MVNYGRLFKLLLYYKQCVDKDTEEYRHIEAVLKSITDRLQEQRRQNENVESN